MKRLNGKKPITLLVNKYVQYVKFEIKHYIPGLARKVVM